MCKVFDVIFNVGNDTNHSTFLIITFLQEINIVFETCIVKIYYPFS